MHIIWTIIAGFLVGIVAKFLCPGKESMGFVITTILGIGGAFLPTFIGQALGLYQAGSAAGFIGAVIGAIILQVIHGAIKRRAQQVILDGELSLRWKYDRWRHFTALLFRGIRKMISVNALGAFIRYCWVLPVSCIGIMLIPFVIVSGGGVSFAAGVIEAEGGILSFLLSRLRPHFPIDAMTIGHVIISQNRESLMRCRFHERVHVRQYERWGPLFLPLYLLSSASALVRGMDPYLDNRFEREAFRASRASMTQ